MSYTGFRPVPGPTSAGAQGCTTCGTSTSLTPQPLQMNYLENLSEAINTDDVFNRFFRGDVQKMVGYAKLEGILKSEETASGIVDVEIAQRILKHIQTKPVEVSQPVNQTAKIGGLDIYEVMGHTPEYIADKIAKKDLKDALKSLGIPFGPATVELTLASALIAELKRRYQK